MQIKIKIKKLTKTMFVVSNYKPIFLSSLTKAQKNCNYWLISLKKQLLFACLFLSISSLHAFQYENDYLSSPVKEHEFDKKSWEKTVEDIDYSADIGAEQEKRKDQQLQQQKNNPSSPPPTPPSWLPGEGFFTILKLLVIIGGIAIIAFLLYKIIGVASGPKDKKIAPTTTIKNLDMEKVAENIHETNLRDLIRQAVQAENYSLAMRLYYLLIIKELSIHNHIKWKKEKTNGDYLNELSGSKLFEAFYQVTAVFERIWYGEMILKKESYGQLEPKLIDLVKQIQK